MVLATPNILKYQFKEDLPFKISDKCCLYMKEKPLRQWQTDNNKTATITAIMAAEGGRREQGKCKVFSHGRLTFNPLIKVTPEWEQWFIDKYNIQLCKLYYEPYNFERTGCKGCPFALNLQEQLETMEKYLPNERKQCEILWQPIYAEYRRIGYRLKKEEQLKLL
jgi:3'-phosphoadenosine 5'-phosphosulfate sulfotransferase (PAPS reductase)/FAD synthetase